MKFRRIPAGSFLMGSPETEKDRCLNEGPVHGVTISQPFYMGVHEVTQEQYEKVIGSNPSKFKGPKHPVENVLWDDAQTFCKKLSEMDRNMTYRLPTEAEWEYACRAGTTTAFYWGNLLDEKFVWCGKGSGGKSQDVGLLQPNAWGLYDMSGNVWEWCSDWYGAYPTGDQIDPKGAATSLRRVLRGGCWYVDPKHCRSAVHDSHIPGNRSSGIGFRVVAVPVVSETPSVIQKDVERVKEKVPEDSDTHGKIFINSIGMKLKFIPAGSFLQGSPDNEVGRNKSEGIQEERTLPHPFYLGVYEVTQEQYEKVTGANPSHFKGKKLPVEMVTWQEAQAFCKKLSGMEKNITYRLPFEMEWEYAARAGTTTPFYWGDTFDDQYGWCKQNSEGMTREVGTRQPNAWGLFDMSGNVEEWCEDRFGLIAPDKQTNPNGTVPQVLQIRRGGSWISNPQNCRLASRFYSPDCRNIYVGFRIVGVPVPGTVVTSYQNEIEQEETGQRTVFAAKTGRSAGEDVVTNTLGMKFKIVPAGSFIMGSSYSDKNRTPIEEPEHGVILTNPFYLGVYEVTQEQYEKVMGKNPSLDKGSKKPVANVTWNDAQEFIRKLSEMEKIEYRLPTEAEWEYACRAGTKTAYFWGNSIDIEYGWYAWSSRNSGGVVHEVGSLEPNSWGFFDMIGNANEWCADLCNNSKRKYTMGAVRDPKGDSSGTMRIIRGGSWEDLPSRSSNRNTIYPEDRYSIPSVGFRVVRDVDQTISQNEAQASEGNAVKR